MRYYLLIFAVLLISCEPTRMSSGPLPPGVERGQTWAEASDFGYEKKVYVAPDYVAYPLNGSPDFQRAVNETYRSDECNTGPEKAIVQYVISEEGQVELVHPITQLEEKCLLVISKTIRGFEFFPAEHKDQSVKILMAATISRSVL